MDERLRDDLATTRRPASAGEQNAPERAESKGTPAQPTTSQVPEAKDQGMPTTLFAAEDAKSFRARWQDVQSGFVDNPRQTVEQADSLVAEVIKRLADSFTAERSSLESQWSRGENVNTEELRMGLQHYRAFFDRLLSI
jgi:hypothetical protein